MRNESEIGKSAPQQFGGQLPATEADVRTCYRMFLGREAESQEVIENMLASKPTLEILRQRFLSSLEFREKASLPAQGPTHKPLDWPPMSVETDVSVEMLERMLRHIESNWQILGQTEPHWSVLTSSAFKADKINENMKSFLESGKQSFGYFSAAAARCGLSLPLSGVCFELGCGVGRVTLQLARAFRNVIASDVSKSHLYLAKEAAVQANISNIEFVHIDSIGKISQLPDFDSFYSVIVLQHNPPPVIKSILGSILLKLKMGGLGYFQVPTYRLNYVFNARAYLDGTSSDGKMEVHALGQPEILSLIRDADCDLLEIREDGWTGSPLFISNSFLVIKRGSRNTRGIG
jgi:SAM-dependent methyltransferase